MRFDTLDAWLDWQQQLHPRAIDLGLERIASVWRSLGAPRIAETVITVAGTNGKGSTVAAYEAWLGAYGLRCGSYTSPHILRYNERIRIDGTAVEDERLIEAFDAIDQARGDTPLTYFEFGALAALWLFARESLSHAILEVGLGGRLDAVNIIDADLAHITPIGLDHQAWLGNDRETIGAEKAGILRPGQDVVYNDPQPVASIVERAESLGCDLRLAGRDYSMRIDADGQHHWRGRDLACEYRSPLPGRHQAWNLGGVFAGLEALGLLRDAGDCRGFEALHNPGRLQKLLERPFALWVDVGHNEDAARVLADFLRRNRPAGRVVLLLGMLEDKDPARFLSLLREQIDDLWLLGLEGDRGLDAEALAGRLESEAEYPRFPSAAAALDHALSTLGNQDILLATGSFLTVEAVMRALEAANAAG